MYSHVNMCRLTELSLKWKRVPAWRLLVSSLFTPGDSLDLPLSTNRLTLLSTTSAEGGRGNLFDLAHRTSQFEMQASIMASTPHVS